MEINLLVLSLGHSRLAIGAFAGGELVQVRRVAVEDETQWAAEIAQAWRLVADRPHAGIAAAAVNRSKIQSLEEAVRQGAPKQKIEWIGTGGEIDLPMAVKTESPGQTGVDRVLATAAAYEQMGKACMVVDAGTAVTVNLCNGAGEFLGGAIAPGARMMLEAMRQGTSSLPEITFDVPGEGVGNNTRQAMLQGVYHSIRGMVKELAEQYAMMLGNWPEIIATGGDAEKLFGGWELIHAVSPDLGLYGAALAYAEHYSDGDSGSGNRDSDIEEGTNPEP
jgi:type III pantothenate kinase